MSMVQQAAPFTEELVATLDGEKYFVAPAEVAKAASGRRWVVRRISDQEQQPRQESVPLPSFHEGAGFSYASVPHVYDNAGAPDSNDSGIGSGWDASVPGRLATWSRHAEGETATGSDDVQGWLEFFGGYLYLFRGRYATKYVPDATAGVEWEIGETADLGGTDNVVAGRPVQFGGDLYIPMRNKSTGAAVKFKVITAVATPPTGDTYGLGPTGKEARAFTTWRELLVRADGENGIATCATSPTTAANWSDDGTNPYAVDEPGTTILDLLVWDRYLIVRNERGLWSFNENLDAVNELPDLRTVVDSDVAQGGAYANASLLVPHEAGLIMWAPGAYRFVGPEQEGALEEVTPALEAVKGVVSYGRMTFVTGRNIDGDKGFVLSLQPGRGGRDPLPHMHFQVDDGRFEGGCIVRIGDQTFLAVIKTDKDGKNARPWVWELPRGNQFAANSESINKKVTNTRFRTPRYAVPGREIAKTYRAWECWVEIAPAESPTGLQVWACVDDGTPFQLLDGTGAAAAITTTGFHTLYFPKTDKAVGHYVYFEFRVPSGGTATSYTLRDCVFRFAARPRTTRVMETTFVLGGGEFEDLTSMGRSWMKQLTDLEALCGPNTQAVPFRTPWGTTGYCTVEGLEYREVVMKPGQSPTHVATLALREERYA